MKAAVELDAVKRAQASVESAASRLVGFKAAAAALDSATPDPQDFDACLAHEEQTASQTARINLAQRALDAAKASLAAAEAAAADKSAQVRHAALVRKAEADGKIVRQIEMRARMMARDLAELDASNAEIAAANADPALRKFGFIADAERRVRERPGYEVPAVYQEIEVWQCADGTEPSQVHQRTDGSWAARGGSPVARVKKTVRMREARFETASMPDRFVSSIKLVNLEGRALWPVR